MENSRWLVSFMPRVVHLLALVNAAFGAAVIIGLLSSGVLGELFTKLLLGADGNGDPAERTEGMRWLLVLGLAMAVAIGIVLHALWRIAIGVAAGDAFGAANVARLRRVGWSLLALQLLDAPAAWITYAYPALGDAAPGIGTSLAGWLAVLLSFFLAHVFATGTRMRDDLEGTV